MAAAMFLTGLGFAVRAAISNTNRQGVNRTTVIAEQFLFVMGQLLLVRNQSLDLIDSHVTLSRDLVKKWARSRASNWVFVNRGVLVVSFILDAVAFARTPNPLTNPEIPLKTTQLRIAGSIFPFLLTIGNAVWLPIEKMKAPEIPWLGLGILLLVAWFLVVPAFYAFLLTAVTADTSPLVASITFFYIAWALFQILAIAPFLAIPLADFSTGPYLMGGNFDVETVAEIEELDAAEVTPIGTPHSEAQPLFAE
ncbi:hypothetical protein T439DRAFT_351460 [Meredithblackwellia eburnea MCA 4105]